MKKSNVSNRLKEIMLKKHLKQRDIVELCKPYSKMYGVKFNKSDISQYVTGKTKPRSDKLTILAMALDIDETWLMGYDKSIKNKNMTNDEDKLLYLYSLLNQKGKQKVQDYIIDICENNKYIKDDFEE